MRTANSSFKSVDTNEFITDVVPSSALSSNLAKVVAAGLEVSYGNTPANDTYVKGQQNAVVGTLTLKATSALDVKVNTVSIVAAGSLVGTAAKAAYSSVSLYDGATQLSTAQSLDDNGKATFVGVNLNIMKNTTKTLTIKANLGTTLNANVVGARFNLDSTNNGLDVVQQPGGSSIDTVMLTSSSPTFTIAVNGAVQITQNSSASQSFNGGATSTSIVSYGIKALTVPYTVNKLAFAFSGNAGAIESVKLVNGTTEVLGSVQSNASGAIIRFDNVGVNIPANQVKTFTVVIKFPIVTISNSSIAGPFALGIYNNTADQTDDNEFVPTNVNGLDNIKDSDYNAGTTTGLQMTTLLTSFNGGLVSFGVNHSLLRASPTVSTVASSNDALVLMVTNTTNESITLSGIVVKAQNPAKLVGGTYGAYVSIAANGTDGSVGTWAAGTVSLGASVVNPGETKYIRLALDGVSFAANNSSNAYFYVDADTSSSSANLQWYVTGTPSTLYNGQGVYSSTLIGKNY